LHGRSIHGEQLVARLDACARRRSRHLLDDHLRAEREPEPVWLGVGRGREGCRRDGGE